MAARRRFALAPVARAQSEASASLRETIRDISHYRELFKFLIAFLIYVDSNCLWCEITWDLLPGCPYTGTCP